MLKADPRSQRAAHSAFQVLIFTQDMPAAELCASPEMCTGAGLYKPNLFEDGVNHLVYAALYLGVIRKCPGYSHLTRPSGGYTVIY